MTTTEDELRAALRLLEQRAPDEPPDGVVGGARRPAASRRMPVIAAAAVVLVVAGLGLFLGLRDHGATPSPAGPPPGSRATGTVHRTTPPTAGLGTLRVQVFLNVGPGPGKPRPRAKAVVTVSSVPRTGHAYGSRLSISTTTNAHGYATVALPPGRYTYRSNTCGPDIGRHRPAVVRPVSTTTVRITCAGL